MSKKSTEGDDRSLGFLLTRHSPKRDGLIRCYWSRGYKASAVCEMVAAREAVGVWGRWLWVWDTYNADVSLTWRCLCWWGPKKDGLSAKNCGGLSRMTGHLVKDGVDLTMIALEVDVRVFWTWSQRWVVWGNKLMSCSGLCWGRPEFVDEQLFLCGGNGSKNLMSHLPNQYLWASANTVRLKRNFQYAFRYLADDMFDKYSNLVNGFVNDCMFVYYLGTKFIVVDWHKKV